MSLLRHRAPARPRKDYGRTATGNMYDLLAWPTAENLTRLSRKRRLRGAGKAWLSINRANVPLLAGCCMRVPFSTRGISSRHGTAVQDFGSTAGIQAFLDAFGSILLSDSVAAWKGADAPAVRRDPGTGEYYVQMNPEQAEHFDRAEYYILAHVSGDEFHLMHTSGDVRHDGGGNLYPRFDGNILPIDRRPDCRPSPTCIEKENISGDFPIPESVLFGRTGEAAYETLPGNLLGQIDRNFQPGAINGAIADAQGDSMTEKGLRLERVSQVYLGRHLHVPDPPPERRPNRPLGTGAGTATRTGHPDIEDGLTAKYLPRRWTIQLLHTIVSIIDTQGHVHSSN